MSERLKHREKQLRLLLETLDEMAAMLRYRAFDTEEMIRELCSRKSLSDSEFLALLRERSKESASVGEAWRAAAEKTSYFSESDREILYRVGDRLGMTDAQGQLSMLSMCAEFTERNLAEARDACRVKCPLFRRTGLLCGAALGIMIL